MIVQRKNADFGVQRKNADFGMKKQIRDTQYQIQSQKSEELCLKFI
jgi:hypothetical protein